MKKPIVKALACALALTMALSSPVSAFAEGLSDVFSSSTDEGSNTGTHTTTSTSTKGLELDEEKEEIKVVGLVIDKESVTVDLNKTTELTATILVNKDAAEGTGSVRTLSADELTDDMILTFEGEQVTAKDLINRLVWFEGKLDANKQIVTPATDAAKVKLDYYKKDANGDAVKNDKGAYLANDDGTCKVTGSKAGSTNVSVKLGSTYVATTDVFVKSYRTKFEIQKPVNPYVKHVINMNDYVINNDGNDTLTWKVYEPKNGAYKKTSRATITDAGILTLKKVGTIRVIATSERGISRYVEFDIEKGTPVTKFNKVAAQTLTITGKDANPSAEVKVTYTPADTTDYLTISANTKKNVADAQIVSYDKGTATVKVTALNPGKTSITVKATSGKTAKINVTVKAPLEAITGVKAVKSVYVGQKVELQAITVPANAEGKIKFALKDKNAMKNIATVSGKYIQANKKNVTGDVVVVASAKVNGKTITGEGTIPVLESLVEDVQFNAVSPITGTGRNKNKLTLFVSKTFELGSDKYTKITGEGATSDMLLWASSKPSVATVDENGLITAVKAGTAKITVSAFSKSTKKIVKDTVTVTVKQPVTKIELKKADLTVTPNAKGKATTVTVGVSKQYPKGVKKEAVTYSLVDKIDGVTVDSAKGKVTVAASVPLGTKIKVKAEAESGAKAYATITVARKTKKIDLPGGKTYSLKIAEDKDTTTLTLDNKVFNVISAEGTDYLEEIISYTANNKNVIIADVDGQKVVYPVKAGKTTITAKTASGKSAKITITITEDASAIRLNRAN